MIPDRAKFEPDCRAAVDDLRAALIELYSSVGMDPGSPQDAARQLGINKTLTWNLSKVMGAEDAMSTLSNIPGSSALQSLLKALQRHGAHASSIERVRLAAKHLDKTIERHVGDRATLELVVDGLSPTRGDRLELSRKLAFRGNSGLWGVQAKTRLMTIVLVPNQENPNRLDIALVRGYLGLRRLRQDVRWPVFQVRGWGAEGEPVTANLWRPLESPNGEVRSTPLMPTFSSIALSEMKEIPRHSGVDYTLEPGPIGNYGAVDVFLGEYERSAVSKFRTAEDTTGEFGATISVPTENLVCDLIAHESLDFALKPHVLAYGGIFMSRDESQDAASLLSVPVPTTVTRLPGRTPVVAHPSIPRYPELVSLVHSRLGSNPAEFGACRYELDYPPLGTTILLRFDLPSA